ncbi:hypothetical protein JHK87_025045 [Glycine soja]|nr:hypothetical protein JHK87_025045 [Glycine soja]
MDRSWMKAKRISDEYENGVEQFLQFTQLNAESLRGNYFCPCVKCLNGRRQSVDEIRSHLICYGIIPNYTKWIWHGELADIPTVSQSQAVHEDSGERIEEMIRDLGQETFEQAHAPLYDTIERDSNTPLYQGCTSFTRLSAVLALVNVTYADDVVRVSVDKVIEGDAEVPFPTSEIQYVRQALQTFIAWPTNLVKKVSHEESDTSPKKLPETDERGTNDFDHDPLRQLIKSLYFMYDTPVELKWDGSKFGLSNCININFYVYFIKAGFWMSGAQLWVMLPCMDSLSHNRYTMQRIDVLNVSITYKHGSRNRNERCT